MATPATTTKENTRASRPRHELKYLISDGDAFILSRRLGMLLARDGNAGPDGRYTVRSLYFDTPADDALRQKAEGHSRRAKWRIRTYGNGLSNFFNLECKAKNDGIGHKRATRLSREEAEALASGPLRESTPDDPPLLAKFLDLSKTACLRPVTVVVYEREAFRYELGNVRITIDSRMRSTPNPSALTSADEVLMPISPGEIVLEVKYDAYLPDFVRDIINVPGAVRCAWSKYALARRLE